MIYRNEISKLIRDARKRENDFESIGPEGAGMEDEVSGEDGLSPLRVLMRALSDGMSEVVEEMHHVHDYNENGFCGCGKDGNA